MKKWKKTTAFVLAVLMLLCGCSQNGGGGADVAGTVASRVLDALVNGY